MRKPWGVIERRGDRRTLLLDFDQPVQPRPERLAWLLGQLELEWRGMHFSRTARGWHVVIDLDRRLTGAAIVAAQIVLGSDIKRERYNLFRVLCGAAPRDWNLLFSRKCI